MGNATSRDGPVTVFCERLPVVGYGVALGQFIAGNGDHAARAFATSTNATITTAGAVLGAIGGATVGMAGGPIGVVAGAMTGGASGSALGAEFGMGAEFLCSKLIDDEAVKGDVGEVSLSRAGRDALIGAVTGAVGGAAGGTAAGALGKATVRAGVESVATTGGQMLSSSGIDLIRKDAEKLNPGIEQRPPKPKGKVKRMRRVVTHDQEVMARGSYWAYEQLLEITRMQLVRDLYRNTVIYVLPSVVEDADWTTVNQEVIKLCDFLKERRDIAAGTIKTDVWIKKEIRLAHVDMTSAAWIDGAPTFVTEASRLATLKHEADHVLFQDTYTNYVLAMAKALEDDIESLKEFMLVDEKWVEEWVDE